MEPLILIPAAALLSFLSTGLATGYSRRRGLIDHPGERHSHTVATPRGGGAGLVLSLLIFSLLGLAEDGGFWIRCACPGILVLSLLGWWDDHASLSARFRFLVQLAVSIYLIGCGLESGWPGGVLPLVAAGLFLLWMTNLYNFMDGSNGMAGTQGVFCGVVLAALFQHSGDRELAIAAALLAACCLGFLPWNLGKARVFMGDTGSLALGFALGALLVCGIGTGSIALPVALMVSLVFLTDGTLTLLLRVFKGERWYTAHKQHLYQRLIVHGWTHGRVLLSYQAMNLALVLPGIVVAVNYPALAWAVVVIMVMVMGLGWYLVLKTIGVFVRAG